MENGKKDLTERELEQASGGRVQIRNPEIIVGTVTTAALLAKVGGSLQATTAADDAPKE